MNNLSPSSTRLFKISTAKLSTYLKFTKIIITTVLYELGST